MTISNASPLRQSSAKWNTKFGAGLDLDLSLPDAATAPILAPAPSLKPRLRLPPLDVPTCVGSFDPFADEPAEMQNTPPPQPSHLARGRTLAPLTISSPAPTTGRRRAPSFSAGSGVRLSSLSPSLSLSSAPILSRAPARPLAAVPGAPSPFMARHYPTPAARERLLARTLLHRIHAVGRPRSVYSSCNGYESECGTRGYVRSRLSECVAVC